MTTRSLLLPIFLFASNLLLLPVCKAGFIPSEADYPTASGYEQAAEEAASYFCELQGNPLPGSYDEYWNCKNQFQTDFTDMNVAFTNPLTPDYYDNCVAVNECSDLTCLNNCDQGSQAFYAGITIAEGDCMCIVALHCVYPVTTTTQASPTSASPTTAASTDPQTTVPQTTDPQTTAVTPTTANPQTSAPNPSATSPACDFVSALNDACGWEGDVSSAITAFCPAQIGAANSAAIWKSLATTALTTGESIVNYLEDSSHSFSDRLGLALGVFAAVGAATVTAAVAVELGPELAGLYTEVCEANSAVGPAINICSTLTHSAKQGCGGARLKRRSYVDLNNINSSSFLARRDVVTTSNPCSDLLNFAPLNCGPLNSTLVSDKCAELSNLQYNSPFSGTDLGSVSSNCINIEIMSYSAATLCAFYPALQAFEPYCDLSLYPGILSNSSSSTSASSSFSTSASSCANSSTVQLSTSRKLPSSTSSSQLTSTPFTHSPYSTYTPGKTAATTNQFSPSSSKKGSTSVAVSGRSDTNRPTVSLTSRSASVSSSSSIKSTLVTPSVIHSTSITRQIISSSLNSSPKKSTSVGATALSSSSTSAKKFSATSTTPLSSVGSPSKSSSRTTVLKSTTPATTLRSATSGSHTRLYVSKTSSSTSVKSRSSDRPSSTAKISISVLTSSSHPQFSTFHSSTSMTVKTTTSLKTSGFAGSSSHLSSSQASSPGTSPSTSSRASSSSTSFARLSSSKSLSSSGLSSSTGSHFFTFGSRSTTSIKSSASSHTTTLGLSATKTIPSTTSSNGKLISSSSMKSSTSNKPVSSSRSLSPASGSTTVTQSKSSNSPIRTTSSSIKALSTTTSKVGATSTSPSPSRPTLPAGVDEISTNKFTPGYCENVNGVGSVPILLTQGGSQSCICHSGSDTYPTYLTCPGGSNAACDVTDQYIEGALTESVQCSTCTGAADCAVYTATDRMSALACGNSQALYAVQNSYCECSTSSALLQSGLHTSDFVACPAVANAVGLCYAIEVADGNNIDNKTASCTFNCISGYHLSIDGKSCVAN